MPRNSPGCECRICARQECSAGSFALSCGSSAPAPETADPQQVRSSSAEARRWRRWPCSRGWRRLRGEKNHSVSAEESQQRAFKRPVRAEEARRNDACLSVLQHHSQCAAPSMPPLRAEQLDELR